MEKPQFFHESIPELITFKQIFSNLKYRNIDLWPSIAPDAYKFHYRKSLGSLIFKFLRILKFLFFIEKFQNIQHPGKNKILATFLIDRADHHNLFNKYIQSFTPEELTIIDAYQKGIRNPIELAKRFWIKVPNPFKIFQIYTYLRRKLPQANLTTRFDRIYFTLLTFYMFKKIDFWYRVFHKLQPKSYVCYSSFRNNDETIMTQICNLHNKQTFTLQNYAIIEYKSFNYESITYENMISNYILLWGKPAFNILKKFIPKDKLQIAGNPQYTKIPDKKPKPFVPKEITIPLDFPEYEKSNLEIIEIVSEFANKNPEMNFHVLLHPDLRLEDYQDKINAPNLKIDELDKKGKMELIKKSDLLILHNTTLALESLEYRIPIIRYKDKTFQEMTIPSQKFCNLQEFEKAVQNLRQSPDYISTYNKSYNDNFFQPNNISIPDLYKKTIIYKSTNLNQKFFHEKIPELNTLKTIFTNLKYRNIELWPTTIENAYVYQQNKTLGTPFFQFLRILKFLLFVENFKNVKSPGIRKILATFPLDRTDHHTLFSQCTSSFTPEEITIIDAYQKGERNIYSISRRFLPKFPNIIKLIKIYFHLSRNNISSLIKSRLDRIYFILSTYYMFKKIDYWYSIYNKYQPKAYLSYAGYRNNDETIMTQICNLHNKPTFSFQNYTVFDFPELNSESITYENMVPKFFLSWGEATSSVLQRFISKERVLTAGNPLYKQIPKKQAYKFNPKTCVIFLDYPQYAKSNHNAIKIIAQFAEIHPEIKFYIKNHPVNDEKEYQSLIKNTSLTLLNQKANKDEWINKADFIILHNTTIALEALNRQIPIFRFKDETLFDMDIPKYDFSTLEQIEALFNKLKQTKDIPKEYYNSYINNFHQPKNKSIPENYKSLILNNIKLTN